MRSCPDTDIDPTPSTVLPSSPAIELMVRSNVVFDESDSEIVFCNWGKSESLKSKDDHRKIIQAI